MMVTSPRHIRLLCHNVRSLWNVGSFFRTCDAFAVEKIYLTGYTGHPPRKEITKTAIGAEEFVPWEHHDDPIPIIQSLQKDGWYIVALEQTADAIPLEHFPLPSKGEGTGEGQKDTKILLIVGHELTGVPPEILSICDAVVCIPMLGKKESLNVAVAAGIALSFLQLKSTRTQPDGASADRHGSDLPGKRAPSGEAEASLLISLQ